MFSRPLIAGALTLFVCVATAQSNPPDESQVNRRVRELLSQMTLEEKIGQLNQLFDIPIPMAPKVEDSLSGGRVGSVLMVSDPAIANRYQRKAIEQSRLHIPLLFGFDVIHGLRTILPVPLGMAASWDPKLIEQGQSMAAREASAAGIRWTFAPMVDIARDPRWGRIVEGAGEDPFLGAAIAAAQVRGFQGSYPGSPDHVLACPKHFGGYGAADGGRDYDSSYIPDSLLYNVYFPPFRAAVEAGAATLMTAYMDLNDVPATGNKFLLQDVLRGQWKFPGFVVSDAFSVADLTTHGFARDPADAAWRAIAAGVDMDMGSATYLSRLGALVKSGKLNESAIDTAAGRILAAKVRLGLFEHPYVDEENARKTFADPEHRQIARIAAQRSAVLLRNEGGTLPLGRETIHSVAVVGELADSSADTLGPWSIAADGDSAVTVLQGLKEKLGSSVQYEQGVQLKRTTPSIFDLFLPQKPKKIWSEAEGNAAIAKATDMARRSDVTVAVLGELQNMNGEDASRASLSLPGRQLELLQALVATGKPVVLVLFSGRPVDITWASEHVSAILMAWHPGSQGGRAITDLLFGDATPGGKLPVSWPRSTGQLPLYYNHNLTHKPESAQGFTSRYWDESTKPLYPFGYGLSYTTFSYANLRVENGVASVAVTNKGNRAGDEVVQIYIHQRYGSSSRPVRELKGFERVTLAPGETRTLRFPLGDKELTYWSSATKGWVREASTFDVWAGGSSAATLHATFDTK